MTNIRYTRVPSPVGELLLIGERTGDRSSAERLALRGIYFASEPHAQNALPIGSTEDPAAFGGVIAQLEQYFDGRRRAFEVELAPRGTAFQQAVWRALASIPYGTTSTYGEIARAIGRPSAIRAVGAANARNPISIIVPCHRVIGRDGALTGYAGGMENKRALLDLEARA